MSGSTAPPGPGRSGPASPGQPGPLHWHDHPETLRRLAASYALGTLSGPARRRFEAVLRQRPDAAAAVAAWNARWVPVAHSLPPLQPSQALWARIEAQAFDAPLTAPARATKTAATAADAAITASATGTAAATTATANIAADRTASATSLPPPASTARPVAAPASPSAWQRLGQALQSLLAPAPAFALAAGLLAGVLLPGQLAQLQGPAPSEDNATELPPSYVGVLATADGRTGLIVSSLRRGRVMDVKRVQAVEVPPGQTLYLWTLNAQGRMHPIGPLGNAPFNRVALPQPAEDLFAQATELGVTLEPAGTRPQVPSSTFVYRGLCGKLWRVPPAPAAAPAASKG